MIKALNLHKLFNGDVRNTNLFFQDMIVFFESEKPNHHEFTHYTSIHKVNYITQVNEIFNFSKPADLISEISGNSIIYYAYIDNHTDTYRIDLHKLDCSNWNEEKVLTYDTGISTANQKYNVYLTLNSVLIGLDDRYAMLTLPRLERKYGIPTFGEILLIDSQERKSYVVKPQIGEGDTLLRMSEVLMSSNNNYIIFKTGRIFKNEKKMIWENQNATSSFKEYFDQVETLAICDLNSFIEDVKNGVEISEKSIKQICGFNEALTIIAKGKDIIYSIDSFDKELTKIKIFNLDSFKINTIEIKTLYDEILYFNEKFYGLISENRNKHLYNITKNEKLFTTSEEIVYVDEDVIITFHHKENSFNRIFNIRKLEDGKSVDTFTSRFFELYSGKNMIMFY